MFIVDILMAHTCFDEEESVMIVVGCGTLFKSPNEIFLFRVQKFQHNSLPGVSIEMKCLKDERG